MFVKFFKCILIISNLAVNPDHLPTVVTIVGERILIAADAEGVVIPQNIPDNIKDGDDT